MKKQIKKLWVKALRSGEYAQTRNKMCSVRGNSFCCLGVLQELYIQDQYKKGNTHIGWENDKEKSFDGLLFNGEESTILDNKVVKWAGLKRKDPLIKYNSKKQTLVYLNDDKKLNFKQIADIIEEQL